MKKKSPIFFLFILSATLIMAQNVNAERIPLIGEKAPAFTAETTNGLLNFPADFGRNWKILFSHPRNFTPVCTSEVLQLGRMQETFEELGVSIAIISVDHLSDHFRWKKSLEEINQEGKEPVKIRFPFIDDFKTKVSRSYGMVLENGTDVKDVRGVFIINPDNIIQAIIFYPLQMGRNMDEIVRAVVALQTANSHIFTPVNWNPGDDVLSRASPYLDPALKDSAEITKFYYKVGEVMWYKRMSEK